MSEISVNYIYRLETLKRSGVDDSDKRQKSWSDLYGWAFGFGITIPLSTFLGLWFGTKLDKRFGTAPFCFLLGGLLGLVSSIWSLYRRILELEKTVALKKETPNRKVR